MFRPAVTIAYFLGVASLRLQGIQAECLDASVSNDEIATRIRRVMETVLESPEIPHPEFGVGYSVDPMFVPHSGPFELEFLGIAVQTDAVNFSTSGCKNATISLVDCSGENGNWNLTIKMYLPVVTFSGTFKIISPLTVTGKINGTVEELYLELISQIQVYSEPVPTTVLSLVSQNVTAKGEIRTRSKPFLPMSRSQKARLLNQYMSNVLSSLISGLCESVFRYNCQAENNEHSFLSALLSVIG